MLFDPVHDVLGPLMRLVRALHGCGWSGDGAARPGESERRADFQDTVPRIRYLPPPDRGSRRRSARLW